MDTVSPKTQPQPYHLIIVGGGMVGASLALALAGTQLNIALVEAVESDQKNQPSFDDRCIALSKGSVSIMQGLGLWSEIRQAATAINEILVCDKGHFGFHRLSAKKMSLPFLGQVVPSKSCGQMFWKKLKQQSNLDIYCPAKVTNLKQKESVSQLEIKTHGVTQIMTAQLIIAADGAFSVTRELSGISVSVDDYGQAAVIANIKTQLPHNQRAIERFTEHGPLALLPLQDKLSLVWTVSSTALDSTLKMSDQKFIQQLQKVMGQRLGRISKVGKRVGYPLKLMKSEANYKNRTLLIGNASHSIHPIAGQGFNLGLRDVAWLAEALIAVDPEAVDIGSESFLQDYQKNRQKDIERTIQFTDTLARVFANNNFVLSRCRNIALASLPFIRPLHSTIAEMAMGLTPPVPRLACGETQKALLREAQQHAVI